ncbi:polyphosphate kinase 1 [Adlercreutzia caecimuris]|uniref:Polyphosphate kinase n=1 Tax=Adlercreutzia caecimuris B7 TaxID=1235794 RepID=R9KTR3_9ACTN|nr:polyphosphate kinase 1 [Adlercreutzia caecimuris]EOS49755.1 polyphosphate kinase 1 [Adlercreutzia caecimuris B7]
MNQQASKDANETTTTSKPPYMQNRELSWLDFNKRVLDQGADPTVPLLERLNFISIFWSNLQEFFMVRVGSLTDLALLKKSIVDPKSGMTPAEQLDAVYARCHELYPYYEETFENLRGLLAQENICQLRKDDLTDEQLVALDDYMADNVLPFLSPQIVNARHPFPHLENGGLYIVVRLDEQAAPKQKKTKEEKARAKAEKAERAEKGEGKQSKNLGAEGVTLGIIPLPRQTNRVIQLPGEGLSYMLVEHAIEMWVPEIFSMYTVKHTNIICVTRNADLDATEGAEEQGEDYREHMKRILKKRSRLAPVRLESERPLSRTVKKLLLDKLGLAEHQIFVTKVPLNMGYTWGLGARLTPERRAALTQKPFAPQWPACLDRNRSIIEQVSEREVLLSYPYQSMDAFVRLLHEAANDPAVISIKITLYRLASQSHLAEALIAAAENGKEVTALFELRARFDESNNIEWSQRFEQAGCHVIYGFRNFKVHSKICTITRQTEDGLQHITQLGTGNYNEKTAKLYTDFSFITTDARIGADAADFFRNMALENTSDDYSILWVAPLMIKQNIMRKIDEQIALAKAGKPCGLFFKTNSITDKEVIDKLVEASQAGVETHLFVRGISCLLPGVAGYTDHVHEVSIVGQLLEHSRIYGFGPREGCEIYLSSADLMTRNMDKRIEIAWPILNPVLREQVLGYLDISWSDTAKLRELLPDGSYTPLGFFAQADEAGNVELFDSQKYLIAEAQRMRLAAAELAARHEAERAEDRRVVFPLGRVETSTPDMPEVVTEEESEFVVREDAIPAEVPVAEPAAASMADIAEGRATDVVDEALAALRGVAGTSRSEGDSEAAQDLAAGKSAPASKTEDAEAVKPAAEARLAPEASSEPSVEATPAPEAPASAAAVMAVAAGATAASVLQSAAVPAASLSAPEAKHAVAAAPAATEKAPKHAAPAPSSAPTPAAPALAPSSAPAPAATTPAAPAPSAPAPAATKPTAPAPSAPAPASASTPAAPATPAATLEPDPFAPAAEIVDPASPSAATVRETLPTECVTTEIVTAPKKLGFFGRLLKLLFG